MEGGKDSVKEKEKAHQAEILRNTYNSSDGLNHRNSASDNRQDNRLADRGFECWEATASLHLNSIIPIRHCQYIMSDFLITLGILLIAFGVAKIGYWLYKTKRKKE